MKMIKRFSSLFGILGGGDFTEFGHAAGEFPFCDALWACSTMFSNWYYTFLAYQVSHIPVQSSVKVGHKRIFLFTNEDNPNAESKNLKEQSFQRAKASLYPNQTSPSSFSLVL